MFPGRHLHAYYKEFDNKIKQSNKKELNNENSLRVKTIVSEEQFETTLETAQLMF